MRSLVILKGLVKLDKIKWVKKENLTNFFIDIDNLKRLFYRPDYKGSKDYLVRSYDDLVYKSFIQTISLRMSTGCLVVVDAEDESTSTIEELAIIFGYTIFYRIFSVPFDYISKNIKYSRCQYLPESKEILKQQVDTFNNQVSIISDINKINSYKDLEYFWKDFLKPIKIDSTDRVFHISDLHSHYNILNNINNLRDYRLVIFLGDFIDGPEIGGSRKLIDYILNDSGNKYNQIYIEGNHELRLRKYLGYLYFKSKNKKIVSEILKEELSTEFMEKTSKEFSDIKSSDLLILLEELNKKLYEFVIYERDKTKFICTHCGLRWIEQLCPKYIGNVIYSNKNPNKIDSYFSNKYGGKIWSIHGHCKYPSGLEFNKYRGVINLDAEDEFKVNYLVNYPNNKLEICTVEESNP